MTTETSVQEDTMRNPETIRSMKLFLFDMDGTLYLGAL